MKSSGKGVRVITARLYRLVRANRNSLRAVAELQSSSWMNEQWSQVDLFQMPFSSTAVNVWAARAGNWTICICCCSVGDVKAGEEAETEIDR